MQFGCSDYLHHRLKKVSSRPFEAVLFVSYLVGKLFRNPLAFILLVWGLMFLILGVTLAYIRDVDPIADQQRITVNPRATIDHTVCDKQR